MKSRQKVSLCSYLKRTGLVLSASLGGWMLSVGASCAQGLSTDLLELPIEQMLLEEIPLEEKAKPLEVPLLDADIPEEILRTEIITGARSPITGEPMTAADYAQLQAELDQLAGDPLVSSDIRYLVFLLQVRRAIRPILPFIP